MKYDNPTSLQIGMSGTIVGIRYRVVGRVVMGMDEGGRTYYWNEYDLVNDRGEFATLVFEQTQYAAEWKLFTLFEPQNPMTAAEAATKKINAKVNLDGTPLRVTLVDESRVYFVEGQGPKGVEVGDVARYFNAEGGNKMFVVSWTGNEVEFYRGMNLPAGTVSRAFGIKPEVILSNYVSAQDYSSSGAWIPKVFVGLVTAMILAGIIATNREPKMIMAPARSTLPAPPLVIGSSCQIDGKLSRIASHADVEIAEPGRIFECHEYALGDTQPPKALLVYGFDHSAKSWVLFTPFPASLSPEEAATYRVGDIVRINRTDVKVTSLRQERIRRIDGGTASPESTFYEFAGVDGKTPFLARWTDDYIAVYRGKQVDEKEIRTAFAK